MTDEMFEKLYEILKIASESENVKITNKILDLFSDADLVDIISKLLDESNKK